MTDEKKPTILVVGERIHAAIEASLTGRTRTEAHIVPLHYPRGIVSTDPLLAADYGTLERRMMAERGMSSLELREGQDGAQGGLAAALARRSRLSPGRPGRGEDAAQRRRRPRRTCSGGPAHPPAEVPMTWWLVKPVNPREGRKRLTPMWISDEGLAVKESAWRADRSLEPWEKTPIDGVALDVGGMIGEDSHRMACPFYGGTLWVYAVHVDLFIEHLPGIERRPSGLYNIQSWPALVVLTPAQRDTALAWLRSIAHEARAFADAENARFNKEIVGHHPHVQALPRPVHKKPGKA
jgi:hypothetical protein